MKTFKEWMKGEEDKPIDSLEDAVMILAARQNCDADVCDSCPIHAYDHADNKCAERTVKALAFITGSKENVFTYYKSKNFRKDLVNASFKKSQELKKMQGTCDTCLSSQMHPSGIRFCDYWHNFTHEDGFCYRYKSDKIEDKQTVDK